MIGVARTAGRILAGAYTPSTRPDWTSRHRRALASPGAAALPELEAALATAHGDGWRVAATGSGRGAILAALLALELPVTSEVLVPSYACAGVVNPVLTAGLRPVFVDIDDELNPALESVLAADGPDVRAIVAPHLAGIPVRDLRGILDWASGRGVVMIEDVAQAFGARDGDGAPVGTTSDLAIGSTGTGKPLNGPGGGWLAARDGELLDRARAHLAVEDPAAVRDRRDRFVRTHRLRFTGGVDDLRTRTAARRSFARQAADPIRELVPTTIDAAEAAVASVELDLLEAHVTSRRANAARWRALLDELPSGLLTQPRDWGSALKVWVRLAGTADLQRLAQVMWKHGVEIEPFYVPLHRRPGLDTHRAAPLPATEAAAGRVACLPSHAGLDDADWARIERALDEVATWTPEAGR